MKRRLLLILALAFMAVSGCATTSSGEKSALECDSLNVYAGLGTGGPHCG